MTQHDPGVTLRQMLDYARGIADLIRGRSRSELEQNFEFQWAVLRGLEILGEAANRLHEDFHARYPMIPWRQMIGMRNRLVHGYENVNLNAVWTAAIERVPPLIAELERVIPEWPIAED